MAVVSEPSKKMTPEELEREWYENVYRGDDMPQLTWRAVIMGSFLGAFLSLQNLYVGLLTGWGLGVAITSCVLQFHYLEEPPQNHAAGVQDGHCPFLEN